MVKIPGRNERGHGLKFRMETFNAVRHFTAHTPIKYGPNPKNKGSKSFYRYAKYMKARTVGEAVKLGAKIADLCWELERGDYKVLKGKAVKAQGVTAKDVERINARLVNIVGPRGLALDMDAKGAAQELAREEAWMDAKIALIKSRAKELGVKLEAETKEELLEDGVYENAETRNGRLVANALAKKILQEKTPKGTKVTESDVTQVLQVWGFTQNYGRVNVLPGGRKWVYSDTLGGILRRTGGYGITPPTKRYPAVAKLLNQYIRDNRPAGMSTDVVCTSININANYGARIHRDANNSGPSAIRAFGDFSGGELFYWNKDDKQCPLEKLNQKSALKLNIKKHTVVFDGNQAHAVANFKGERVSVVWFSIRSYHKLGAKNINKLKKDAGFKWPNERSFADMRRLCGRARVAA